MSELSVIEATSKMLSLHGESELVYLTAEFSPFSNRQKPDLLFYKSDLKGKRIFFVEYKENINQNYIVQLNKDLIEHQDFVQESILERFTYIFATNTFLKPEIVDELKQNNIIALCSIENESDIYNAILTLIK
jgi:hypothetical protein